jgi:hypothetical protein
MIIDINKGKELEKKSHTMFIEIEKKVADELNQIYLNKYEKEGYENFVNSEVFTRERIKFFINNLKLKKYTHDEAYIFLLEKFIFSIKDSILEKEEGDTNKIKFQEELKRYSWLIL